MGLASLYKWSLLLFFLIKLFVSAVYVSTAYFPLIRICICNFFVHSIEVKAMQAWKKLIDIQYEKIVQRSFSWVFLPSPRGNDLKILEIRKNEWPKSAKSTEGDLLQLHSFQSSKGSIKQYVKNGACWLARALRKTWRLP